MGKKGEGQEGRICGRDSPRYTVINEGFEVGVNGLLGDNYEKTWEHVIRGKYSSLGLRISVWEDITCTTIN